MVMVLIWKANNRNLVFSFASSYVHVDITIKDVLPLMHLLFNDMYEMTSSVLCCIFLTC